MAKQEILSSVPFLYAHTFQLCLFVSKYAALRIPFLNVFAVDAMPTEFDKTSK